MKSIFKFFAAFLLLISVLSACNSSKFATGAGHNRRVDNRGYRGY